MAEFATALAALLVALFVAIWDKLLDSKIVVTRSGRHREQSVRFIDRMRNRPKKQNVPDGGRPPDGP